MFSWFKKNKIVIHEGNPSDDDFDLCKRNHELNGELLKAMFKIATLEKSLSKYKRLNKAKLVENKELKEKLKRSAQWHKYIDSAVVDEVVEVNDGVEIKWRNDKESKEAKLPEVGKRYRHKTENYIVKVTHLAPSYINIITLEKEVGICKIIDMCLIEFREHFEELPDKEER